MLVGEPQSLVSYHLRLLRDGGLVTARRSSADRRDSYYAIDLAACRAALRGAGHALHPALRLARRPSTLRAVAAPTAGALPLHGEQRAVPDRRGAAHTHVRRGDRGGERGESSETTSSQRRPRPSQAWNRHQRQPHQAHRRVRRPSGSTRSSPCATAFERCARSSRPDPSVCTGRVPDPASKVRPTVRRTQRSSALRSNSRRASTSGSILLADNSTGDPHMPNDEIINVRYMVEDVEESIAFYTKLLGFELLDERGACVRRCEAGQPSSVAVRTEELGRPSDAGRRQAGPGRLEPDPPHRRRHRHRDRTAPRRRRVVPQRRGGGSGREADPAPGPVWQRRRAVPARRSLIARRSGDAGRSSTNGSHDDRPVGF